ncbi:MAG: aminotransferase class III-fold pyridoxal phosphate-dependent enzyme, partial [Actinobacteria bacterium]|nr:aminotransferase class III-fold pyridoxal phosphate-dependent enzyme [Actinomycetota bacterium]
VPDVVSIAKGMGNGAPIAGVCATDEIAMAFRPGDHGSTFGGGPLVCAASLATLRAFRDENIEENVNHVGLYLREKLNALPHVKETRGLGLMLAIEFDGDFAPDLVQAGLSEGLVLNCIGGNIMRFLPPLVCTEEDVDVMVDKLTALIERIG